MIHRTHSVKNILAANLSKWDIFVYALPMMAVWSIYLLAYWPGGMSPDSVEQWKELLAFKFIDWHPVFHTLTYWLITRLWLSPAAVVMTQIVILSLVLGWGLLVLRQFGSPRWLTWLTVILLAALPSVGFMVIVLWKDVFYSTAVTALTIMILELVLTRGQWIEERFAWISLGAIVALIALYRQNGIVPAFGTMTVLLFAYRDRWKLLARAFVLALLLWAGIRGPFYTAIGVNRDVDSGLGIALSHLIARYTNTAVPFSTEERALLTRIRGAEVWPYNCYMENALFYDGNYDYVAAKENINSLVLLSAKLIHRDPQIFLQHLACNGSFAYQITQPPNSEYETVFTNIFTNDFGLKTESKLPGVKSFLSAWDGQTPGPLNWLIWRVPFWNYLLFGALLVYSLRTHNWKSWLIMVPIVLNILPLIPLTISQAYRFVFSSTLVSVLMAMPLLLGFLPASQELKSN